MNENNCSQPAKTWCVRHHATGVHENGDGPCKWEPKPKTADVHDCEARGCDLTPRYRKLKRRALYVMDDFSDAECREVLRQMIHHYPQDACEAICAYWSESIERHD